jgi:hypothetical protein
MSKGWRATSGFVPKGERKGTSHLKRLERREVADMIAEGELVRVKLHCCICGRDEIRMYESYDNPVGGESADCVCAVCSETAAGKALIEKWQRGLPG